MKVKLTGINPQSYGNPFNDYHIELLQQLTFPIETETHERSIAFEDEVNTLVVVYGEEWSIDWFTFEIL